MSTGRVIDRIRKLAQDARKDGNVAYAKSLFEVVEDMEREFDASEFATTGTESFATSLRLIDSKEAAVGDLGRLLDVLRVDRIVLERSPNTNPSSVEQEHGEDEEGA